MDVVNQVNGTLNQGLDIVNNNRIASTVLGLFLALYASLAAPNLPSSVTVIFKNNWFRLAFMFLIAYMATRDTSLAIITAVALLVTLLTLSAHETTNTVVKAVESKINANIENFAAVPALSTSDYDQLEDYSLSNSDERIQMGSGFLGAQGMVDSQNLLNNNLSGVNQANEEKRALEAKKYVFQANLGGDTYSITGEHDKGSVVNTVPDVVKNTVPEVVKNAQVDKPHMESTRMESEKTETEVEVVEDTSAPSLLDLVTGFENVPQSNEILPFSGPVHYDVKYNDSNKKSVNHGHNEREEFQNEPELPSSCGVDAGLAVPGFDLGEFAQFQL